MFARYFGEKTLVVSLDEDDFQSFVEDRRNGVVAPAKSRSGRSVRDRAIEYDLRYLSSVFRWATGKRDRSGEALLSTNPLSGFEIPTELNPNRPLLFEDEYEALVKVAGDVDWRFEAMLRVAHETGHRIGAVRRLRWSDVDLEAGRILWRADTQKNGHVTGDHRKVNPTDLKLTLETEQTLAPTNQC